MILSLGWQTTQRNFHVLPTLARTAGPFSALQLLGRGIRFHRSDVTEILRQSKPDAHMHTTDTCSRGLDHPIMPFGFFWLATEFLVKTVWLPTCLAERRFYKYMHKWFVRKYLDLLLGSYKRFHCALTGEYSSSHSR